MGKTPKTPIPQQNQPPSHAVSGVSSSIPGGRLFASRENSSDRTVPLDEPIECNEADLAFGRLAFGQMGDAYITLDIQAAILKSYRTSWIDRCFFFFEWVPKTEIFGRFFFSFLVKLDVFAHQSKYRKVTNPSWEIINDHCPLITRWWFQICFILFPYLGKRSDLTNIFFKGPTRLGWGFFLGLNVAFSWGPLKIPMIPLLTSSPSPLSPPRQASGHASEVHWPKDVAYTKKKPWVV